MHILAVIPAREGSKRVPLKNIRMCAGKPLIAWTIECVKEVPEIENVIVSTESLKIKQVAESYGALVPFLRPNHLADDQASSESVIDHVLYEWSKKHPKPDVLLLLQATSPLRTPQDIRDALSLMKTSGADSVETVLEGELDPRYTFSYQNVLRELKTKPTGSIYLVKVAHFLKKKTLRSEKHFALIRDSSTSIDIDTEEDFKFSEQLLLKRNFEVDMKK